MLKFVLVALILPPNRILMPPGSAIRANCGVWRQPPNDCPFAKQRASTKMAAAAGLWIFSSPNILPLILMLKLAACVAPPNVFSPSQFRYRHSLNSAFLLWLLFSQLRYSMTGTSVGSYLQDDDEMPNEATFPSVSQRCVCRGGGHDARAPTFAYGGALHAT